MRSRVVVAKADMNPFEAEAAGFGRRQIVKGQILTVSETGLDLNKVEKVIHKKKKLDRFEKQKEEKRWKERWEEEKRKEREKKEKEEKEKKDKQPKPEPKPKDDKKAKGKKPKETKERKKKLNGKSK